MQALYSPRVIAALLEKYQIAPLKQLGQNFLKDAHVVERIAEAAVLPGENIVEIGPGLGVLTQALAGRAAKVVAVELDAGMNRVLAETMAPYPHVQVIHGDILKTDLKALCEQAFGGQPFAVTGNLPYYITSKCLLHVLESGAPVSRYTAMVQSEVADRLAAGPGSKTYGALSASVAYFGQTTRLFSVPPGCFYPQPDVDSAVIQIVPTALLPCRREDYVRMVRGLFGMRRKTVLNNLRRALALDAAQAQSLLARADIAPGARAETLSPADFCRLAQCFRAEKI